VSFVGSLGGCIFLSPHFDDVALSCGGLVARLADDGRTPLVVTIFGGEVTSEVTSTFARFKEGRWGVADIDAALATRRAEESAAIARLGARGISLGFPDAIYRAERYISDDELYSGELDPDEDALVEVVATEIRGLPGWGSGVSVFVPLGAGLHIDHLIVHDVGQLLASEGTAVYAYEDCPYVIHTPSGLTTRLSALGGALGPAEAVPIGATLERRLDAIAAYSTQVPIIFRFTDNFRSAVTHYASSVGGARGPAERYWPLRTGSAGSNSG
jgi:LmbE family N-acetylglucosaminyl deacetylase